MDVQQSKATAISRLFHDGAWRRYRKTVPWPCKCQSFPAVGLRLD